MASNSINSSGMAKVAAPEGCFRSFTWLTPTTTQRRRQTPRGHRSCPPPSRVPVGAYVRQRLCDRRLEVVLGDQSGQLLVRQHGDINDAHLCDAG